MNDDSKNSYVGNDRDLTSKKTTTRMMMTMMMTKEVEDLDFGLTIGEAYNSSFSMVCEIRACREK